LRTTRQRGAGLGHLGFDRIAVGVRLVALPLQVVEGLIEASYLGVDVRQQRLVAVDLSLQRLLILPALCLVFEVKLILPSSRCPPVR